MNSFFMLQHLSSPELVLTIHLSLKCWLVLPVPSPLSLVPSPRLSLMSSLSNAHPINSLMY